jgi:hypothetical protein
METVREGMVIAQVTRFPRLSKNGNPRHTVIFTDGTVAPTKRDASINYGIDNSDMIGVPLRVTMERGEIVYAEKMEG